jgi:hypothetical protein
MRSGRQRSGRTNLGITIAVSVIAGTHIRFAYGAAFGAGGVLDEVGQVGSKAR